MRHSIKATILSILSMFISNLVYANDCIDCSVGEHNTLALANLSQIEDTIIKTQHKVSEGELDVLCSSFRNGSELDFRDFLKKLDTRALDYLTGSSCMLRLRKIKAPAIFDSAEYPGAYIRHIKRVVQLYEKSNPNLLKIALNAKNEEGQTLLDYINYLNSDTDSSEDPKVIELISVVCKSGGEYSKYKNDKKCPQI